MNIKDKIAKVSKSFIPNDPKDLEKKLNYSKKLLDKGILKKNNYDFPQVDTLGKSYYSDYFKNKVED